MPKRKVNSAKKKRATNDKKEAMNKLIKAIEDNNISVVKQVLTAANNLTVLNFYEAILKSVRACQEETCHFIIDHNKGKLSKFEQGQLEEMWETVKDVIYEAAQKNMESLVKKLVDMIGANKCVRFPRSPMLRALAGENPGGCQTFHTQKGIILKCYDFSEIVEVLIKAGVNPGKIFDMRDTDNSTIKEIVHQIENADKMTEQKKKIWKLLIPHFTARQVLSSRLLDYLIKQKKGGLILSGLNLLELDFSPFLSSTCDEVKSGLVDALNECDVSTVIFIVDHGFDVNSPIQENATTVLHYICKNLPLTEWPEPLDLIAELIERGADPNLKNDDGLNIEELCVHHAKDCDFYPEGYVLVFKLLQQLGYTLSKDTRSYIYTSSFPEMSDLAREIEQVPNLQILCRKIIRTENGSKINDFMEKLNFPPNLKDYILLKDFIWDDFELSRDGEAEEDYSASDYYESGSEHSNWDFTESECDDDTDEYDEGNDLGDDD